MMLILGGKIVVPEADPPQAENTDTIKYPSTLHVLGSLSAFVCAGGGSTRISTSSADTSFGSSEGLGSHCSARVPSRTSAW
ncbi:hypothetical protein A3I42_03870 [Candidatus Uhrbacteria bacterium RIFCSPLOWO2_02_FULL_49_11]|uniref:Uncharacterized protein n=1 Tax=Candidatus Uhrbacteria bacterium RIFCSPLOWO2_02_FULL_49_11 TaxID=1802409 RepID=A0A1F7VBL8_9BACT|nr:MAG: hypothetical protein A3I42_03870 [Candidatus Uhrbacteria bacterium RIFCSPLOWO2_02_FULL_49_11]